ncbi:hypothetical protein DFH11DRAFT_1514034 [Phellopilus nigrolimitatus]|nr:hypothetical protein DFH11DRAFT_1514034 [Phellopilus nigrolimitatus]
MVGRSTLRDASMDPALWKAYYMHRYTHADVEKESERRSRLSDDWRRMYYERRQQDHKALDHLQVVIETTRSRTRVKHAREIAKLGLDAWDALVAESTRPLPVLFQSDRDIEKVKKGMPLTNLSRKYWSSELQSIIAKRDAIEIWSSVKKHIRNNKSALPSFEEAFATLSSFHGILSDEILKNINSIADLCRENLEEEGVPYVPGTKGFDTPKLCIAICAFMRSQGFDQGEQNQFYDIRNSLPHLFISTQRRSLPLSLVFIFVTIAKRLGLPASALDTPGRVLALVRGTFVDVYGSKTRAILNSSEDFGDTQFTPHVQATLTASLLGRVARNISVALAQPDLLISDETRHVYLQARFLASCLSTLFGTNVTDDFFGRGMVESLLFPLDLELVVRDRLIPNSRIGPRGVSEEFCDGTSATIDVRESEIAAAVPQKSRASVKIVDCLFVGQIIMFSRNGCLGCVVEWERTRNNKYLYSTISFNHHDVRPVHSEDVTLVDSCSSSMIRCFLANPLVGLFFEDAEFVGVPDALGAGRGRFIMNARMRQLYPDDDECGARWVRGDES